MPGSSTAVNHWADKVAERLRVSDRGVIGIGLPDLADPRIDRRWLELLAAAALRIARNVTITRWLLEGGATAQAIFDALGLHRLHVGTVQETGLAELLSDRDSPTRYFVKPGSYAWPPAIWPGK